MIGLLYCTIPKYVTADGTMRHLLFIIWDSRVPSVLNPYYTATPEIDLCCETVSPLYRCGVPDISSKSDSPLDRHTRVFIVNIEGTN